MIGTCKWGYWTQARWSHGFSQGSVSNMIQGNRIKRYVHPRVSTGHPRTRHLEMISCCTGCVVKTASRPPVPQRYDATKAFLCYLCLAGSKWVVTLPGVIVRDELPLSYKKTPKVCSNTTASDNLVLPLEFPCGLASKSGGPVP